MKNKMLRLFEAVVYYTIYLFSGVIGNIAAVIVGAAIIGFEYVSNHMLVDNAVFFDEIMSFVRSETSLCILLSNCAVLLIYLFIFRSKKDSLWEYTGCSKCRASGVFAAVIAGFIAHGLTADMINSIASFAELMQEYRQQMEWVQSGNAFVLLIVILVAAPFVEELVFRGVLISSLSNVITPIGALVVTSALFGFAHGNTVQGIYSFLLGVMLAFVKIRSGSLWHSVAMHLSFNAANIITAFGFTVSKLPVWITLPVLIFMLMLSGRKCRPARSRE